MPHKHGWMWNLSACTICKKIGQLSTKAKELSCDTSLKMKFEASSLPEFSIYMKEELSQVATKVLVIFGVMYLCENHFQQWQQLNQNTITAFNLKVAYKLLYPRISHLVSNMQAHPSHWISTDCQFYTLWVSMVSTGEDHMIYFGWCGENRGWNLMGNKYNIRVCTFSYNNAKEWPTLALPVMINVKQWMGCDIWFCISMVAPEK
jgi:hypothetical protein